MLREEISTVKLESNKLQKTHEDTINIFHEENCAIREQIDEKNAMIKNLKYVKAENEKMKKDMEARELFFKEQIQQANEENARLKEENDRIINEKYVENNSFQVCLLL